MAARPTVYEDRWGPFGAVAFRLIIPIGLIGLLPLLLIAGMFTRLLMVAFVAYALIVALVAFCGIRSTLIVRGPAKWVAAAVGLVLTAGAALLAFGLFIASGGV
jgi:hypothetical protein